MTTSETRSVAVDDGTEVDLYLAHPSGTPRGGLIVLQEIFGVNAHIQDVTRRLAAEGWLAAAPDLFHRQERGFQSGYEDIAPGARFAQATTQAEIRADIRATFAELRRMLGGQAKIGAIGFCMGGRQAYVANGILPLACAISFYGSNIVGLPELAATQSGPVLLLWGGRDPMIDAAQRRAVADMLHAANGPFVEASFDAASHGFYCDARSAYHPESAAVAWALAKAFLDTHLA